MAAMTLMARMILLPLLMTTINYLLQRWIGQEPSNYSHIGGNGIDGEDDSSSSVDDGDDQSPLYFKDGLVKVSFSKILITTHIFSSTSHAFFKKSSYSADDED